MKKTKIIICAILAVLITVLPFCAVVTFAVLSPPQYTSAFVGALDEKYERLCEIEEPKIVIIGGSSAAFGIDSALIEKYTGMPVVNFGLYASLGTKLMLDLSKDGIRKGDVVIIAPELDPQTLSLYFNAETTLQAFDGNFSMIKAVREENLFSLLGGMWSFAKEKLAYMKSGNPPNPEGVYNSNNFNEYGDVVWKRDENVMSLYYDPNMMIDPNPEIFSDEFSDYINEYVSFCEKKGASVYYSFAPMNKMGLAEGTDAAKLSAFSDCVEDKLDCAVMSEINNCVYDAGYFYDTNFHLNEAGVRVHTVNLVKDILLEFGIPTLVKENIPEPPSLPELDVRWFSYDENSVYFTYEKAENGAYKIIGLTELGKQMETLTIPQGYDTYAVMYVAPGAFSGGKLKALVIPENTNLRGFESFAFSGAEELRDLWIYYSAADDIMPPADFIGTHENFRVHVPSGSSYDSQYYWSERGLTFVKDAN